MYHPSFKLTGKIITEHPSRASAKRLRMIRPNFIRELSANWKEKLIINCLKKKALLNFE